MESKVKSKTKEIKESNFNKKETLLKRAENQFLSSNYLNALKIYGLILSDYPQTKDAEIGACLSNVGLDSDEDAQALFDYYQLLKESGEEATEIIYDLLEAFYESRTLAQEAILGLIENNEVDEGISYRDFLNLVETKGSFQEAFEDTMFSTKVVIQSKSEFMKFIKQLVKFGYEEKALKYLDNLADSFGNDQDIYQLYYLIDAEKR
jgi:hypothetical protein